MRHFAITGIVTAFIISSTMVRSAILATPPAFPDVEGTLSKRHDSTSTGVSRQF